jgi:hypothetical protein
MPSDPLANMIERLRGRGWQPRKVGQDRWESRCPGHASADHALALGRTADGKLDVKCRSIERCSLSRIVKKLDLKLDRLFGETPPTLIRRLREMELQPSIFEGSDPSAHAPVNSTCVDPENEQRADISSATSSLVDVVNIENGAPPADHSSTLGPTDQSNVRETQVRSSEGILVPLKPAHRGRARSSRTSAGTTADRGETTARTNVDELLKIAGNARTFRRPEGGYSLSRPVDDHTECHDLDSPEVSRWLTRAYYESTGRLPSTTAVAGAIFALAAHADMNRSYDCDFVRVGRNESGSSCFLDLGDPTWRAVEISAAGWQIVPRPEVHFRRSQGQVALPTPARDGTLGLLKKYVNVESGDLPLLIAWITAALRPVGPHPILVITGEQGSAKSTLARICRLLIDPHTAPLRAEPREHRDLMVAALNGWVQAYDNISALPDWLSNGLCRLVTGGGISMRGLHTNHQEVVWSAQRPVILNGIDEFVQRPDVFDRCVCLQLRPIMAAHRRCEEDFWADFRRDYPRIFGGVLDAVASALRLLPAIKLAELERMADFTRWGEAVAQAVGWSPGTFVSAYRGNRRAASVVALEDSDLAKALVSLNDFHGPFKGTVTQLLQALTDYTGSGRLTIPGWPKTPNVAATELRRLAPLLRVVGLSVTFERGANGTRLVSITSINRDGMPAARRA